MSVFRPLNCLKCPLCEVVKTRASRRSRRCITNSVAAADTVCSQWDDQRAEKAIKGVCPSVSGRLNTKNDLSLRWTGRLTDPPLFITRLLSYFLDDWTVSPLSREPNRQLLKEWTSQVTQQWVTLMWGWFFFLFIQPFVLCPPSVKS